MAGSVAVSGIKCHCNPATIRFASAEVSHPAARVRLLRKRILPLVPGGKLMILLTVQTF
jgi:hypothetical protein